MNFDSFFVPLIGGYLFLSLCHRFRFVLRRKSGYHLLFQCAVAGAILLVATVSILEALPDAWHTRLKSLVSDYVQDDSTAPALLLTLIAGPLTAWVVNLFYDTVRASMHAVEVTNDAMEQLLVDALLYKDEHLVEITLTGGKVYVGWVLGAAGIVNRRYIELLPLLSGYRSSDTRSISYTYNYAGVLQRLTPGDDAGQIRVVVSLGDVEIARPFITDGIGQRHVPIPMPG